MAEKFDQTDRKIIALLQRDATQSVASVGQEVGLSQNACWRRIRRLEESGVLKSRVAIFDAPKLGYPLTVFVILRVQEHSETSLRLFAEKMVAMPEVVGFYRTSGDIDYLAKLVVRDVKHYDEIYKRIISIGPVRDVSAAFSMEDIKCTTALPVDP